MHLSRDNSSGGKYFFRGTLGFSLTFEIFRVVGEEHEGWVKVRRISIGGTLGSDSGQLQSAEEEEGYIPIAFTEPV